jgi:hypothetical protein
MPAFCLAWPVLRAWANGEMSIVVLLLLSLALAGFHAWERQGFVDLIGRYDAEVRHLSTWHPPDLDRSRP